MTKGCQCSSINDYITAIAYESGQIMSGCHNGPAKDSGNGRQTYGSSRSKSMENFVSV